LCEAPFRSFSTTAVSIIFIVFLITVRTIDPAVV